MSICPISSPAVFSDLHASVPMKEGSELKKVVDVTNSRVFPS